MLTARLFIRTRSAMEAPAGAFHWIASKSVSLSWAET